LAWLGLAWLGLAWLGLAWLGLAWLGLAWFRQKGPFCWAEQRLEPESLSDAERGRRCAVMWVSPHIQHITIMLFITFVLKYYMIVRTYQLIQKSKFQSWILE
jgi:hypothetical protein